MSVNIMRCTRCGGVRIYTGGVSTLIEGISFIGNTDMHVNSFFFDGLSHIDDVETDDAGQPLTVSISSDGTTATLSSTNTTIQAGDIVAIAGAGYNSKSTLPGTIYHVTKINSITGTTYPVLHLETPADVHSVSGLSIYINPPSIKLVSGKLTTQHYYIEEILDRPMELYGNSSFVCSDFKISGGTFGCRTGYSIMTTGLTSGIDINLHFQTLNNSSIKGVVGFGLLKDDSFTPSLQASVMCKITAQNRFSDWVNSYLFSCISIPVSIRTLSPYTLVTTYIKYINAYAQCTDGKYIFSGSSGSNVIRPESSEPTSLVSYSSSTYKNIFLAGTNGDFRPNSITIVSVKNISTGSTTSYGVALVFTDASNAISFTQIAVGTSCSFQLNPTTFDLQFKPNGSGNFLATQLLIE